MLFNSVFTIFRDFNIQCRVCYTACSVNRRETVSLFKFPIKSLMIPFELNWPVSLITIYTYIICYHYSAFGWFKCREHISLLVILCIILYVTNKAHHQICKHQDATPVNFWHSCQFTFNRIYFTVKDERERERRTYTEIRSDLVSWMRPKVFLMIAVGLSEA